MRRNLFEKASSIRRKLFSESNEANVKSVICGDCGFKMETSANTTNLICPKCGGKRFNIERKFFSPEGTPKVVPSSEENSRVSLFSEKTSEERFQKSFSNTTDQFELRLKKYSGTTINTSDCERIFGKTSDEMVQKGFAEVSGNTMNIQKDAFLQSRLFSKLIISVTKVLDLDPKIVSSPVEGINRLEATGGLCPKGIVLIKKAHGILPPEPPHAGWLEESGISRDLPIEFGGRSLGKPEFERIISERYPDAPHDISDILGSRGIIKISGDHIDIIK